jgi:hypothetical protein
MTWYEAVTTPARAERRLVDASAGTGLAVRTEMAVPIMDAPAAGEAEKGAAGVEV